MFELPSSIFLKRSLNFCQSFLYPFRVLISKQLSSCLGLTYCKAEFILARLASNGVFKRLADTGGNPSISYSYWKSYTLKSTKKNAKLIGKGNKFHKSRWSVGEKKEKTSHNQICRLTSIFLSLKHQTLHMLSLYCLFQENGEYSHNLPFLICLHICASVGLCWQKDISYFP